MILWFGLIAVIGIYNIISFPGILRAFDPSRAVMCMSFSHQLFYIIISSPSVFVRTGHYDYLAGVVLALTGCEAMFAKYVALYHCLIYDLKFCSLGQFNALSIRVGLLTNKR
jgi:K+ transporter